ncbi:MAG: ferrochelatase [Chlamydiales bacterium]|nr:ferrochelatase [Chlamydiales bacterium]
MEKNTLIVNFGGPRNLDEIESFLIELLTDEDVIRTPFPSFLQRSFFTRIAKKRTLKVKHDYEQIGGRSPIFEDTEAVAEAMRRMTGHRIATFHRYLLETHASSLQKIADFGARETLVFPMFPQFSYATTGSIARFFQKNLPEEQVAKLRWIKSYATHPAYIRAMQSCIREYLAEQKLAEKEVVLLFSAHGLPQKFVNRGDPYQQECVASFFAIAEAFPLAISNLSYQSKFGRGEWLRPYTDEVCESIRSWNQDRVHVVLIPLSFTSDHIETLFEIETLYLTKIREAGLKAYRCPALNQRPDWLAAIPQILHDGPHSENSPLIRQ